jgi:hypothetical protein
VDIVESWDRGLDLDSVLKRDEKSISWTENGASARAKEKGLGTIGRLYLLHWSFYIYISHLDSIG